MPTATYSTPGTYTFTVPDGVTLLTRVQVIAGGGGGNGGSGGKGGGGGGGGGYAAETNIVVTPGEEFTVVVGAGGTAVPTAGGNSSFSRVSPAATIAAASGGAGGALSGTVGGGTGTTGSTLRTGGTGASCTDSAGAGGGGGAGAAADGSAGTNNTSATTGTAGGAGGSSGGGDNALTGGDGGRGADYPLDDGDPGQAYGGGGGGGCEDAGGGGIGGDGVVRIEYNNPAQPSPGPDPANTLFFNDFVGNFGLSSFKLSHTQVIDALTALRPSGSYLQDDPSLTTSQDSTFIKFKVLPPNSGVIYERIRFRHTALEPHFIHLASGLTLDMRVDSITNTPSGIMEVYLDLGGSGYLDSTKRYWYSGPIGLPSGMDQLITVSKPSLLPIDGSTLAQDGNITIHVRYDNHGNDKIDELNIYSLKLCGEHAFNPITIRNSGTTLYTVAAATHSGTIPLIISGMIPISGYIPLFVEGDAPTASSIPLHTASYETISSGIPLFIDGRFWQEMNLFIKAADPTQFSGILPLTIFGSTPGTVLGFDTLPLYVGGNIYPPSGSLNLYIGGTGPLDASTTQMPLFLKVEGTIDGSGNVIFPSTNVIPMFVANEFLPSGIDLYLEGQSSLPSSGWMNLYIARSTEGLYHVMPLSLTGPTGSNNTTPLFLHADQNFRNNITLYVSGVSEQTGTAELYTHGF